jgi:integrase
MPRPTKDGAPSRPPRKRNLTELLVKKIKPEIKPFKVWDLKQRGLVLQVQPSGHRSLLTFYRYGNRACWYFIANADRIGLDDARRIAARVSLQVAEGKDPAAERRAERSTGTFGELALAYRERYAKKHNKSWQQAAALVDRYLLPRWRNLPAANITRADVRAIMDSIAAPVLANQVRASASAIFTWGMKQDLVKNNPCRGVDTNPTQSRERVLSDSEIPAFWKAFDDAGLIRSSALKFILLTGQRPGEVAHMRYEHIKDGWWEMPGAPDHKIGWPGLKNKQSHRVWLSSAARAVIAGLAADDTSAGFVFANSLNRPVGSLDDAMRDTCSSLGIDDKATPHDLRRTFSTKVTKLKFGRDAMNRVTNHKEGGIASVYDRHGYADENKRIMETVADHLMLLAEARNDGRVVIGKFGR